MKMRETLLRMRARPDPHQPSSCSIVTGVRSETAIMLKRIFAKNALYSRQGDQILIKSLFTAWIGGFHLCGCSRNGWSPLPRQRLPQNAPCPWHDPHAGKCNVLSVGIRSCMCLARLHACSLHRYAPHPQRTDDVGRPWMWIRRNRRNWISSGPARCGCLGSPPPGWVIVGTGTDRAPLMDHG